MKRIAITVAALALAAAAQAQVHVQGAWVRATVPQQKATGAFMEITSTQDATLVGASSPVAGVAEVHEMAMDNGVMKMRHLEHGLPLPAGKTVVLKSGGYHVMLMDLKGQVKVGDMVPLTLVIKGHDGKSETVELKVPARSLTSAGGMGGMKH